MVNNNTHTQTGWLSRWKFLHKLLKSQNNTIIIDNPHPYSGLYPGLYCMRVLLVLLYYAMRRNIRVVLRHYRSLIGDVIIISGDGNDN